MAFASVSSTAAIWQGWGLKYIFRPLEEKLSSRNWESTPEPVAAAPQPAGQWQRPAPVSRPAYAPANKPAEQPSLARQPQAPQFRPVPREQWPAIWQEQFAHTRPGKIAWTYWHLAADLLGERHPAFSEEGRAARRKVMGRLLADLGHKAGTHTFWPAQMDLHGGDAEAGVFWSGLKALGCRALLIFGSQAAWPLLNTRSMRPLTDRRHNGVFVYILNDMDRLSADESQYRQSVVWLRSCLRMFTR